MIGLYHIYILSLAKSLDKLNTHKLFSIHGAIIITAMGIIIYMILIEKYLLNITGIRNLRYIHILALLTVYIVNLLIYFPKNRYVKIEEKYNQRIRWPSILMSWLLALIPYIILGTR